MVLSVQMQRMQELWRHGFLSRFQKTSQRVWGSRQKLFRRAEPQSSSHYSNTWWSHGEKAIPQIPELLNYQGTPSPWCAAGTRLQLIRCYVGCTWQTRKDGAAQGLCGPNPTPSMPRRQNMESRKIILVPWI